MEMSPLECRNKYGKEAVNLEDGITNAPEIINGADTTLATHANPWRLWE